MKLKCPYCQAIISEHPEEISKTEKYAQCPNCGRLMLNVLYEDKTDERI